jgi:hypothetical protein
MLHETAIAIRIPFQKRRRRQTSGSKMPNGTKSKKLPLAFRTQNACAVEPWGRSADEQVSDARLGWSSIPSVASTGARELRLGVSVTAARPER